MKRFLLAGASLMALITATASASATTIPVSGAIVDFIVPTDGTYQIIAFGAQGGINGRNGGSPSIAGGLGAEMGGEIFLAAGSQLKIAVGGMGASGSGSYAGGGGGGSFVVGPGSDGLLVAAGGGGGAGGSQNTNKGQFGYGGQTVADATDGFGSVLHRGVGSNGSEGLAGIATGGGYGGGGGGGGFNFGGASGYGEFGGIGGGGGGGYPGLEGGAGAGKSGNGGFGGGGGGGLSADVGNYGGGGGGGGFSGGGGGEGDYHNGNFYGGGGGGGGSFDALDVPIREGGVHEGGGEVMITLLEGGPLPAVPEPSTWVMIATGFAALGFAGLFRRRKA
jgi:hypothetical protein